MGGPEVNTKCGRLRGVKQLSVDGFEYCAFKGIPYAKPPVGELRFKDPVSLEPWTGVRDAVEFGPMCAQFDVLTKVTDGSDDCLYLNVYVNSVDATASRPVMFYIHGGGFNFGSGNDLFYGPDYLLKKDIVLVTINYRLGVLGFLDLEDEVAPGNQGLKDQVKALEWVRDNITNFGGDPNNVTIFGESAGGASVHYLTLTPLAKGLFHKAISQSGVAVNPWASVPGDPKISAYQLCELLGKKTTDPKEIVKLLRTVDALKLVELQKQIGANNLKLRLQCAFGPGVDNKSPNPYITTKDLATKNPANVPYLLGYNEREATSLIQIIQFENDYESKENNFSDYVHPNTIEVLKGYNLTTDNLKQLYLKTEKISEKNYTKYIDLMSDLFFVEGIHRVVKTQVEQNSAPTYLYQFTYDRGYTFPKAMFNSQISGASHLDELLYLFGMKFFEKLNLKPITKDSADYKIVEQMVELWTNFAKTGRPTPTTSELIPIYWQPVIDGKVLRYFNIGEELRMEKVLNLEERFSYKKV